MHFRLLSFESSDFLRSEKHTKFLNYELVPRYIKNPSISGLEIEMLAKVEEVAVGDLVSCREKTFSMLVVFTTFQITSKKYFYLDLINNLLKVLYNLSIISCVLVCL